MRAVQCSKPEFSLAMNSLIWLSGWGVGLIDVCYRQIELNRDKPSALARFFSRWNYHATYDKIRVAVYVANVRNMQPKLIEIDEVSGGGSAR
jgi:hypothetical protein